MDIGSLFFRLGFKSKGTAELNNYKTAIDGAMDAAQAMQETFNEMLYVIEKMAIEMGALTQAEMDQHKADLKLLNTSKQIQQIDINQNKVEEKKIGLLHTAHSKLSSLVGTINAYRLELIGAASALIYFTHKTSEIVIEFDKLSSSTGISADTLQRVSAMAAESGASIDDLGSAVERLQKSSIDIMLGKGDISPYAFLGLDPHQDPLKLIERMQAKLKSMPVALGTKAAEDLGFSKELIYFLRNADQIKPPPKETLITEDEMKRLKEFNFYFNRIFDQARRVLSKFGATIQPFVSSLLYAFDRMTSMVGGFLNFISPFQRGIEIALILLSGAALAVSAILFPFMQWFLILSAALLVIEDIYSYFKGDKSIFGAMVYYLKEAGIYLENLIKKTADLIAQFTSSPIASITAKLAEFIKPTAPTGAAGAAGAGSVTNNNNILIDGTKNPEAVGKAVMDHITKTTSDAYYQFAPGGF